MRYIILGHSNPDVDSILSGILLEKVLNKKYNTDEYKFIIPEEHIDTTSDNIIKELGIDLDKYKDNLQTEIQEINQRSKMNEANNFI